MEFYQYAAGRANLQGYNFSRLTEGITFSNDTFRQNRDLITMETGSKVLEFQTIDDLHTAIIASFVVSPETKYSYTHALISKDKIAAENLLALLSRSSVFMDQAEFEGLERDTEAFELRRIKEPDLEKIHNSEEYEKTRNLVSGDSVNPVNRDVFAAFCSYLWQLCRLHKEGKKAGAPAMLVVPEGWSPEAMAVFFMEQVVPLLPEGMPSYMNIVFGASLQTFGVFPASTACFVLSGKQDGNLPSPCFDLMQGQIYSIPEHVNPVTLELGRDLLNKNKNQYSKFCDRLFIENQEYLPDPEDVRSDFPAAFVMKHMELLLDKKDATLETLSKYLIPRFDNFSRHWSVDSQKTIKDRQTAEIRRALSSMEKEILQFWKEHDDQKKSSKLIYEWFLDKGMSAEVQESRNETLTKEYLSVLQEKHILINANEQSESDEELFFSDLDHFGQNPLLTNILNKRLNKDNIDVLDLLIRCIHHADQIDIESLHKNLFDMASAGIGQLINEGRIDDVGDLFRYEKWTVSEREQLFDEIRKAVNKDINTLKKLQERICPNENDAYYKEYNSIFISLQKQIAKEAAKENPSIEAWNHLFESYKDGRDLESFRTVMEPTSDYIEKEVFGSEYNMYAEKIYNYIEHFINEVPENRVEILKAANQYYDTCLKNNQCGITEVIALNKNDPTMAKSIVAYAIKCIQNPRMKWSEESFSEKTREVCHYAAAFEASVQNSEDSLCKDIQALFEACKEKSDPLISELFGKTYDENADYDFLKIGGADWFSMMINYVNSCVESNKTGKLTYDQLEKIVRQSRQAVNKYDANFRVESNAIGKLSYDQLEKMISQSRQYVEDYDKQQEINESIQKFYDLCLLNHGCDYLTQYISLNRYDPTMAKSIVTYAIKCVQYPQLKWSEESLSGKIREVCQYAAAFEASAQNSEISLCEDIQALFEVCKDINIPLIPELFGQFYDVNTNHDFKDAGYNFLKNGDSCWLPMMMNYVNSCVESNNIGRLTYDQLEKIVSQSRQYIKDSAHYEKISEFYSKCREHSYVNLTQYIDLCGNNPNMGEGILFYAIECVKSGQFDTDKLSERAREVCQFVAEYNRRNHNDTTLLEPTKNFFLASRENRKQPLIYEILGIKETSEIEYNLLENGRPEWFIMVMDYVTDCVKENELGGLTIDQVEEAVYSRTIAYRQRHRENEDTINEKMIAFYTEAQKLDVYYLKHVISLSNNSSACTNAIIRFAESESESHLSTDDIVDDMHALSLHLQDKWNDIVARFDSAETCKTQVLDLYEKIFEHIEKCRADMPLLIEKCVEHPRTPYKAGQYDEYSQWQKMIYAAFCKELTDTLAAQDSSEKLYRFPAIAKEICKKWHFDYNENAKNLLLPEDGDSAPEKQLHAILNNSNRNNADDTVTNSDNSFDSFHVLKAFIEGDKNRDDWFLNELSKVLKRIMNKSEWLYHAFDVPDNRLTERAKEAAAVIASLNNDMSEEFQKDNLYKALILSQELKNYQFNAASNQNDIQILEKLRQWLETSKEKSKIGLRLLKEQCREVSASLDRNNDWYCMLQCLLKHFDELGKGWSMYFNDMKKCVPDEDGRSTNKPSEILYRLNCVRYACMSLAKCNASTDIRDSLEQYLKKGKWAGFINKLQGDKIVRKGLFNQKKQNIKEWLYKKDESDTNMGGTV